MRLNCKKGSEITHQTVVVVQVGETAHRVRQTSVCRSLRPGRTWRRQRQTEVCRTWLPVEPLPKLLQA